MDQQKVGPTNRATYRGALAHLRKVFQLGPIQKLMLVFMFKPFFGSGPKGHRDEFSDGLLSRYTSVYSFYALLGQKLALPINALRSKISPFRSKFNILRPKISPFKPKI